MQSSIADAADVINRFQQADTDTTSSPESSSPRTQSLSPSRSHSSLKFAVFHPAIADETDRDTDTDIDTRNDMSRPSRSASFQTNEIIYQPNALPLASPQTPPLTNAQSPTPPPRAVSTPSTPLSMRSFAPETSPTPIAPPLSLTRSPSPTFPASYHMTSPMTQSPFPLATIYSSYIHHRVSLAKSLKWFASWPKRWLILIQEQNEDGRLWLKLYNKVGDPRPLNAIQVKHIVALHTVSSTRFDVSTTYDGLLSFETVNETDGRTWPLALQAAVLTQRKHQQLQQPNMPLPQRWSQFRCAYFSLAYVSEGSEQSIKLATQLMDNEYPDDRSILVHILKTVLREHEQTEEGVTSPSTPSPTSTPATSSSPVTSSPTLPSPSVASSLVTAYRSADNERLAFSLLSSDFLNALLTLFARSPPSTHSLALHVLWLILNNTLPLNTATKAFTTYVGQCLNGRMSVESRDALVRLLLAENLRDPTQSLHVGLRSPFRRPQILPALLTALSFAPHTLRADTLRDLCACLLNQASNCKFFADVADWQTLLFCLLLDVPSDVVREQWGKMTEREREDQVRRERETYNVTPASVSMSTASRASQSQRSEVETAQLSVFQYVFNVFAIVHSHAFSSSTNFQRLLCSTLDQLYALTGPGDDPQNIAQMIFHTLINLIDRSIRKKTLFTSNDTRQASWQNLSHLLTLIATYLFACANWQLSMSPILGAVATTRMIIIRAKYKHRSFVAFNEAAEYGVHFNGDGHAADVEIVKRVISLMTLLKLDNPDLPDYHDVSSSDRTILSGLHNEFVFYTASLPLLLRLQRKLQTTDVIDKAYMEAVCKRWLVREDNATSKTFTQRDKARVEKLKRLESKHRIDERQRYMTLRDAGYSKAAIQAEMGYAYSESIADQIVSVMTKRLGSFNRSQSHLRGQSDMTASPDKQERAALAVVNDQNALGDTLNRVLNSRRNKASPTPESSSLGHKRSASAQSNNQSDSDSVNERPTHSPLRPSKSLHKANKILGDEVKVVIDTQKTQSPPPHKPPSHHNVVSASKQPPPSLHHTSQPASIPSELSQRSLSPNDSDETFSGPRFHDLDRNSDDSQSLSPSERSDFDDAQLEHIAVDIQRQISDSASANMELQVHLRQYSASATTSHVK